MEGAGAPPHHPLWTDKSGARELGVNEGTLGNWVARDRQASGGAELPVSESERAELQRLRRELAEAQMERDVLIGHVGGRAWAHRGRLVMS